MVELELNFYLVAAIVCAFIACLFIAFPVTSYATWYSIEFLVISFVFIFLYIRDMFEDWYPRPYDKDISRNEPWQE